MKTKIVSMAVLVVFLLSACGNGAQPPASESTSVLSTATLAAVAPTAVPAAMPALPSVPNNHFQCKKSPVAFTNVGFGFPPSSYVLPSMGNVKTIVLFADFEDVSASQTPEEVFSILSPKAEKFYNDISYGRMKYVLEPHFAWLRLSNPSSFYAQAIQSGEGHRDFIQEAVTLADADVDFSTADSVAVIIPPEVTNVAYGPAFQGLDYSSYTADGKNFTVGVTSGADLTYWGSLWLNHEVGHNMGLPDLYTYGSGDIFRFVGGYGLMGDIGGYAPEYFAYERWQLGWIDDEQIYCQVDELEQTNTLTAIEVPGGLKAVVYPVSETKVIVVESRRRLGYDANLPKEGVLVYLVDTSIASGAGTLSIVLPIPGDFSQATLGPNESVYVSGTGIVVTVIESTSTTDTVVVAVDK